MPPVRAASLLFAALAAAGAAVPEYSQRIWRTEDGLPQNKIQAISQTPDGFLWIGTSGGLVRFDGVRFSVFDRANTPAFHDDSILSLLPGRSGALWIGTEGGGLVLLQHKTFTSFGVENGIANGFVRNLYEDRSGTLWVGTDRGFFRRDGSRFERLDGRGGIPIFAVRSMAQDRDGVLWVGSSAGTYKVEANRPISAGPAFHPLGINITSIRSGPRGDLWFAGDTGIWQLPQDRSVPESVERINTRALSFDRAGNLWAATVGRGLLRIHDGQTTTWRAPRGLPDNTVSAVFEDREGNLWAGTEDGLVRYTHTAVDTLTTRDGLSDDNVATVYQDRNGTLWIATATGELYRREGDRLTPFPLPLAAARSVYLDRAGAFWFGSLNEGAMQYSAGRTRSLSMADGLRSNLIRQFLQTSDGMLWIATGSGLSRWDGHALRTFYLEDGLAYGGVRVLAEDRNGDLLVGTDGGMNRVRAGVFLRDSAFRQLGNERVWSILPSADGTLWLGTRGDGLYRIRNGSVTHLTVRDGLLSNSIYQILDDTRGRLWFSTPAGIFSAGRTEMETVASGRPGPIAIVPYGASDGLDSTQMNGGVQTAGCRTTEGDLWFPSVKGAVRIDPRQMHPVPAPPVLIESARLNDRLLPLSAPLVIPPGGGKLEIDYTSCELHSPDRVTFQYRLDNVDHEWISAPHRRSAVYANLSPGRYLFRVQARDGAFPGTQSEASLAFTWKPRFWETFWFRCLAAAVFVLLGWAGFQLYARQTRARYSLVLAERTRVAREMHDTLLQGCVGVSTLLEAASTLPAAQGELLDHARSQIRLTIDEARDALWDLRNSKPDPEFAASVRSFAQQTSHDSGIPVTTEFTGSTAPLDPHLSRTLLLVAREAIRNAIAHAKPSGITVRVAFERAAVSLEVSDNGIGFQPDAAPQNGHFGIVGMRERVEQVGGELELRSSPGCGATVRVVVPLRQSAVQNSSREA